MKYSQLFGKPVKDVPKDASLVSHRLLYKGSYIRQISAGRWSFTPLGMRVWEKIYRVIDKEMKVIGSQKLVVPTLHPIEIWRATGRDEAFGEEMHIIKDHHGSTFALGATAEVVMVELVKMFSPSYRDLPIDIFQFSMKFRDEKRPRGGIMRDREFMMKDAYNFCADEKQFMKGFQKYYDAYLRLADKFGLSVLPVLADSGAIGGSLSYEFQAEHPKGDQTYFVCDKCGYAANAEKAEFERAALNPDEKAKPFKIIDQPEWVCTMEDNVKHYSEPLWRYLKNVVYKDAEGGVYIASVRGDQTVNEVKLKRAVDRDDLVPAEDGDLYRIGTKPGYVHSWGIKGVIYVGDTGLPKVKNYIGGQKEDKTDSFNVNYGRDFEYDRLADIVEAKDGDFCSKCDGGKLRLKTGFEWGHCFKIDHFYTQPQEAYYTDKNGKKKLLWMGSYGIGIERTMACIVEAHHDERGIVWPESVAPFEAQLLSIGQSAKSKEQAEKAYEKLTGAEIEVLYDDREEVSAGEKFADADLIGCPVRLVVSERTGDKIEWKRRDKQATELVSLEDAIKRLKKTNEE